MGEEMSQRDEILSALRAGDSLTPLAALKRFGCMRLAARIEELRLCGYWIETIRKRVGTHKRVAEYRLVKGAQR